MKPIDHFDATLKEGHCPWVGLEMTQTSLTAGYICRRDYEAGARGDEACTADDWKRCPLITHAMPPSFRATVTAAERAAWTPG